MQFHVFCCRCKNFLLELQKKSTIFFWLIQTKFPLPHIYTKNFVGPTKFLLIQQNIFLDVLDSVTGNVWRLISSCFMQLFNKFDLRKTIWFVTIPEQHTVQSKISQTCSFSFRVRSKILWIFDLIIIINIIIIII